MSAFEDFVQVELPKRPYLNSDVAQNSIIVRKGVGPRQLDSIALLQGQIVTVNGSGELVAAYPSALVKKFVLTVSAATATWNLPHNLDSEDVIVQCFDENKFVIIPDSIQIVDANNIQVKFAIGQTGVARVIFLD